MARPLQIAALLLSLAMLAGSTDAHAAPKRSGGKKGSSRSAGPSGGASAKEKAAAREKAADPLGEIGSGGVRGATSSSGAAAGTGAAPQRGPTRIDFDDRLIQGQTNKSGAVYLYDRKELQTKSMVKKRETFRQEILSTVYDTQ